MALNIRQATIEDIWTIEHLAALTWPNAYADILTPGQVSYMINLMYNPKVLLTQMKDEDHHFLLAEEDGKPVGFAGFSETEPGKWKLHKLYVLPFQQKTGAGKRLLLEVESKVVAKGAHSICLNVNRNNNAQHFYKKMGYYIAGEGDFDIGNGFSMNDYIMQKDFASLH